MVYIRKKVNIEMLSLITIQLTNIPTKKYNNSIVKMEDKNGTLLFSNR